MISYLSAGCGRAMGAVAGFVLAGFFACDGLTGVASAQQPPPSVQMFGPDGQPIGGKSGTVQVKASGRVLDAETGQPLPAFYLTTGAQSREPTGFDWTENSRMLCTNGAFTVNLAKERLDPAVLIEADGYLPQCSGPIHGLETNLTFRLKKGSGPSGVVLTPDGRPAAGRTVYFSRLKDVIALEGPTMTPNKAVPGLRATVTSDAGRFSFAPDLDAYAVVVADDLGFAQVRVEELKTSPEVRLQPWARVEGTLRIGSHPGSNETVRLASAFTPFANYPRSLPPCLVSNETTTDSAGRFVFSRVPPLDVKLLHIPSMSRGESGLLPITQITNLALHGGETQVVTLGGQGRPVTGRVVLKNYSKPIDWQGQVFWINAAAPRPADCPDFESARKAYHAAMRAARTPQDKEMAKARYLADQDQVARQLRAWDSSAAGRRYCFSKRQYVLRFAKDGSFRIDDVPGGDYQLTIDLRELVASRGQSRSPLIALGNQEIHVPDSPGGQTDTPFDLGVINMIAWLDQGDIAPDFSVPTLDGKTVKLSDFKGKYVLLHFWAASNAPSVAEMPNLKETYAAFKSDPRLVMIGLNLDPEAASARAFSSENHLEWTQGFLGKGPESQLAERFGVGDLPLVMLINPSGRVEVNGLRGGTIKPTVDAALSPQPQ
jgi:peroxiredoxin